MSKWKVLVTRKLPEKCMKMLYDNFEVVLNEEDRALSRDELIEKAQGCDAVLTQLVDKIDEDFLSKVKGIKIVANYAVGFDNIDLKAATKHHVMIANTPGVLTNATAETAWALLFAAARHIASGDKYFKEGKYKVWSPTLFLGQGVTGKTLGVIGAGRIGGAFIRMSKGFNMRILYTNIERDKKLEDEMGAIYTDKNTILKEADFISIHVPLTQETRHMIGKDEFALMKKTAVLVNTSRGPVIDEKALVYALKNGLIFAAGLDVYEHEPKAEPELYTLDNVVTMPHVGSGTIESRTDMGTLAASNITDAYEGKVPRTLVNKDVINK